MKNHSSFRLWTLAFLLFAALCHFAPAKSPHPDVGAGRVSWFDITTTNMAEAKNFYGKLFGWTFEALKGTDQAVEILAAATSIGTLRVASGQISSFNGLVYIQVADMAASCELAKSLGGKSPPGFPFNLGDGRGAVGLVVDPSGHPVGLYSQTPLPTPPAATK